jgi:hypothetical protein
VSVVHRWLGQANIDAGRCESLTTAERADLTQLRREKRVLPDGKATSETVH